MPAWLPSLICLHDFHGDWERYEATLYEIFCRDFMKGDLAYGGLPVRLKRHPVLDGKEATFWHLISEGSVERERLPDLRRCERIGWPRALIEQAADPCLKVWENTRKGEKRVCLWLEAEDYLLILAHRNSYVLPWTAYMVTEGHRKRKLQREYEDFCRDQKC
jgi:hypothetical protein